MSDDSKKVKKAYKSAKKVAKKHGKLREFNIVVAVILVLAIVGALVWYFCFYEPAPQPTPPDTSGIFKFDTYQDIDKTDSVLARDGLTVHFINVGQADSTLILLPDGRNMLIDAGYSGKGDENIKSVLQENNITTIDYALLTHTDNDHVNYFDDVLDMCEVKNLFIPKLLPNRKAGTAENRYTGITSDMVNGVISTKVYYEFFIRADDEMYTENGTQKEAMVYANVDFMNISGLLGTEDEYQIDIYCMPEDHFNQEFDTAEEKNGVSPTVIISYQGIEFVLTGDGVGYSHENFLSMYEEQNPGVNPDFDVYRTAHHGSNTYGSNNEQFIKEIETEYAVISCEEGHYNGIPNYDVIANLEKYGNKVYRTDKINGGKSIDFKVKDNVLYTPEMLAA